MPAYQTPYANQNFYRRRNKSASVGYNGSVRGGSPFRVKRKKDKDRDRDYSNPMDEIDDSPSTDSGKIGGHFKEKKK